MKKILALFLVFTMVALAAACNTSTNDAPQSSSTSSSTPSSSPEPSSEPVDSQNDNETADDDTQSKSESEESAENTTTAANTTTTASTTTAASTTTVASTTTAANTTTAASTTIAANTTTAANTTAAASTTTATSTTSAENSSPEQNGKILVAYFSRVGNTIWEDGVDAVSSASINIQNGEFYGNAQLLAQMAQQITGGDLFLIQTVESYPSGYRDTTDKASVEQSNNARPALASHVKNMEQYDTIVLIYPNWWGTLPMPLYTFLEEYDFSGKTILPLCTHEGSRMGSSVSAIGQICPGATLLNGLDIRGSSAPSAQSDVEAWINNSGILR